MTESEIMVSRIKTGQELREARRSYREPYLAGLGWAESIEAGRSNVFAARIDEVVVGYAILSMVGPHPKDVQFRRVLESVFPGEEKPTPVAYGFRTRMQFRNLGVAKAIGRVMENRVMETQTLDVPDVIPRIALSVNIKNKSALSVYNSLGYRVLIADGQGVFNIKIPKYPRGKLEVGEEDVFFMAKDLSEPPRPA